MSTQLVVGHVSQETALVIPNYQLNKRLTPLRYWVETRVPYGQRLMKQTFNHRSGLWFAPKPVGVYHDIVVMFFDPSYEPPLQNFSSVGEFVTTHNFNLNTISADYVDQFKSYYPFDETQLALIDEHFNPTTKQTLTEPQQALVAAKRGPGRPAKETDPRLIELQIRKAELEVEKAELAREQQREEVRAKKLINDERERRLNEKAASPTVSEPAKPMYDWLPEEDCKAVEEAYGFIMLPFKRIMGPNGVQTYDREHEEAQREQHTDFVEYCKNNPRFVPTQLGMFRARAEILNIDISMLPYATGLTDVRSPEYGAPRKPITMEAFEKNGKEAK